MVEIGGSDPINVDNLLISSNAGRNATATPWQMSDALHTLHAPQVENNNT